MHLTTLASDQTRGNWPFPPVPPIKSLNPANPWAPLDVRPARSVTTVGLVEQGLRGRAELEQTVLTRREMLGDVALVLMWGAMVPGLLWLGHIVGY